MPKEDTQFKEGQSGNPNGRPKGTQNFTTKVRVALEKIAEGKNYTYEEAFIKSILKKGIVDGDPAIIRLIWNYLDGLPKQTMDLTSDGERIGIFDYATNKANRTNNRDPQIAENEQEG